MSDPQIHWTPPRISHQRAIKLLKLMADTRGDARMAAALLMGVDALKRELQGEKP